MLQRNYSVAGDADTLGALNELSGGSYIDIRKRWVSTQMGLRRGGPARTQDVLLKCPGCGQTEWLRIEYARQMADKGGPHLCYRCLRAQPCRKDR